ncbi:MULTISPECIES: hypothetical protein [Hyphobacterium]|uniref:Uncharacterized protein n=1 Tax=Hyphobacterium vulgare TaxID=1736751 RepID=A0ABV6ZTD1_9PROT
MSDDAVQAMTQSQRDAWMAFCEQFNLSWEFVDLEDFGVTSSQPVLKISSAKSPAGILILPPGSKVMQFSDRIIAAGYGFSVVDVPMVADDLERFRGEEMLADWGLI